MSGCVKLFNISVLDEIFNYIIVELALNTGTANRIPSAFKASESDQFISDLISFFGCTNPINRNTNMVSVSWMIL